MCSRPAGCGFVDVGRAPDVAVLDAAQDRVVVSHRARSIPRVLSLPWLPWWFTQVSPSTWRPNPPGHSLLFQEYFAYVVLVRLEGVRRRAHADDRPARLDVIDDVLHLVVGQVAKAREDDHQVGRLQGFQAGDVVVAVGVDRAVLGRWRRAPCT